MVEKSQSGKKSGGKKLDNIISKLAEHQLNKTVEDGDNDDMETVESQISDTGVGEKKFESSRKSKRKPEKTSKTLHDSQEVVGNDEENDNDIDNTPIGNLTVVKPVLSDDDIDDLEAELPAKPSTSKKSNKKKKKSDSDDKDVPDTVNCTACDKSIRVKSGKLCRHPDLNTIMCKTCYKFHSSGKFTKDEYGVEEYCRWCADGGDLICCDFCEKAFCKECVKRNLGRSKLNELLSAGEDEQWHCFACDPEPISNQIQLCNRVMRVMEEKKDLVAPYKDKKGREIIHGPNRSERRNMLTNITGKSIKTEVTSTKKTYSKRFQNGINSDDESEVKIIVKAENDTDANVDHQMSDARNETEDEELKNNAPDSDDNKKGNKKNKNYKKKEKSKSEKVKVAKTNTAESESDDDFDDFITMIKKDAKKVGKGKQRSKSKKRVSSSTEASTDDESESESNKPLKKSKKSKSKRVVKSDGSDESTGEEEPIPSKVKKRVSKNKSKTKGKWKLRRKRGKDSESGSNALSDEESPVKAKRSKNRKEREKKRKKKRKRDSDEDSEDENQTPSKKGRKKIRKILDNGKLEEATKHARKLEEERRQRLVERTKNTTFEKPKDVTIESVVLEYEADGKTPLVEVDHDLVKHLKPHQVEGVKFMYDCTIESVKSWEDEKEEGGGCILAHVMGLGKTLQVVTLVHTLYRNESINLRRILVVSPLNTVLNWQVEFEKWINVDDRLDVYVLNEAGSKNWNRVDMLKSWHSYGGVLIMGYTMFRNLSQGHHIKNKKQRKAFKDCLIDPGAELVVCDEGHILRNCKSAISQAMNTVKTKRRIVLTGTPLQNNLLEYHCMVSFVKPNLLGTLKEFSNSFVHPIENGQCADSTSIDVRLMKNRCHVLHKMLEGCVQRKDYADIQQFLPPKFEYVIKIRLSEKQRVMYKYYLDNFLTTDENTMLGKGGSLFSDYQALMRIWTHPWCLKIEAARQAEKFIDTDDSMADFVVATDEEEEESALSSDEISLASESSHNERDSTESSESESDSQSDSDRVSKRRKHKPERTRSRSKANTSKATTSKATTSKETKSVKKEHEVSSVPSVCVISDNDDVVEEKPNINKKTKEVDMTEQKSDDSGTDPKKYGTLRSGQEFKEDMESPPEEQEWYDKFLTEEDETNIEIGSKLYLLLEILADATALEDKVLVFSHSLVSLDLIERALGGGQIGGNKEDWCRGCDYFRMDGSTSVQLRKRWSDIFNDVENKAARLFLISTKAGGLGINLVGASRVVVFDISWNPSHDVQSVFRTYRFGQNKPVFVYRFIAEGTMEEKIYDRQVTKLSVSQRVVDEHQIDRHFNANDLRELYRFEPDILKEGDERPTPVVPKDPILAELINRLYPKWIVKYHEHDSLLRNRPEEELSEVERKEAWEHYEAEKQGLANKMQFNLTNGINPNVMNANSTELLNRPNPVNNANASIPVQNSIPTYDLTGARLAHANAIEHQRLMNLQHLHLHQQQQQQRLQEEQRRRLYELQVRERERQRNEERIRQAERLRQQNEERQQQMQNQQFLRQLLQQRGNPNAYVSQQAASTSSRHPGGQSVYRLVVNPTVPATTIRRSPPRIIELPPDA